MENKVKCFLIVFAILFFLASCRKNVPKPKQEGSNKLYCKVDGKLWKPKGQVYGCTGLIAFYSSASQGYNASFSLNASHCKNKEHLTLVLDSINGIGQYIIGAKYGGYCSFQQNDIYYTTDSIYTGIIDITTIKPHDDGSTIFAGTFEFIAREKDGTGLINITEGWFDIKD